MTVECASVTRIVIVGGSEILVFHKDGNYWT